MSDPRGRPEVITSDFDKEKHNKDELTSVFVDINVDDDDQGKTTSVCWLVVQMNE